MKNGMKKTVLKHIAKDTKEFKEQLKEDAQLKKAISKPKAKKTR